MFVIVIDSSLGWLGHLIGILHSTRPGLSPYFFPFSSSPSESQAIQICSGWEIERSQSWPLNSQWPASKIFREIIRNAQQDTPDQRKRSGERINNTLVQILVRQIS